MLSNIKFIISKLKSSKFMIKGKCRGCGKCCSNIVFFVNDKPIQTKKQFELLKNWKKSYEHFFISGIDDDGALLFTCRSLDTNNKCKDYVFRSLACRNYPRIKNDFIINGGKPLDGCGYYFDVDKKFRDYIEANEF